MNDSSTNLKYYILFKYKLISVDNEKLLLVLHLLLKNVVTVFELLMLMDIKHNQFD